MLLFEHFIVVVHEISSKEPWGSLMGNCQPAGGALGLWHASFTPPFAEAAMLSLLLYLGCGWEKFVW